MPAIIPICLMVILGFGLLVFQAKSTSSAAKPTPSPTAVVQWASGGGYSRVEVAGRLAELARSPIPKDLAVGAMCYEMAAPPNRVEYVCPVCGEKTIYAEIGIRTSEFMGQLPACRRIVREIKGLKVTLDESQFCKKCSPKTIGPLLGLIIDYPGKDADHRVWGVTYDDLVLIKEFTEGKKTHQLFNGAEEPLKDHLARLEELLGVKI